MVHRQGHNVLSIAILQCASEMVCRDEVKEFRGRFQRHLALKATELLRLQCSLHYLFVFSADTIGQASGESLHF